MHVEMTTDELMVTLDGLRVLKTSYENVRGYSPDFAEDWMETINSLIKRVETMLPIEDVEGDD